MHNVELFKLLIYSIAFPIFIGMFFGGFFFLTESKEHGWLGPAREALQFGFALFGLAACVVLMLAFSIFLAVCVVKFLFLSILM